MCTVLAIMALLCFVVMGLAENVDPIRVSSQSEPQSVISEQDVNITIKIYNSSQQDLKGELTLFNSDRVAVEKYSGLGAEQSVTYTGIWHVKQDQIREGRINYYIRYTITPDEDPLVRTVPVTIQTEAAAPQLAATYTVSPLAAREGQQVEVQYTLSNIGNIELQDIVIANPGISSESKTVPSLSVGERLTVSDHFIMGTQELVSEPKISYHAAGSTATLSVADMARRTITQTHEGIEIKLEADHTENIYPGETVKLTTTLRNTGDTSYTGLGITLSDGTQVASGVELALSANYSQTIDWTPGGDMAIAATVSGYDGSGEPVILNSEAIQVTTQDISKALILDVQAQAERTVINSEPAQMRFAVQVTNIGETDAATLTVSEGGTRVATIPSLPSGQSRTLIFDTEVSIAGAIQFAVSGKDAEGNDRSYTSQVIQLTYVEPTAAPTSTPAPTPVPPTPSPVPTATPVPTLMETIQETVKPIHLIIGGVVLAVLVLLLIFFRMRAGMQQKSVEKEAIDTISIASDVRDSSGKRRKTRRKEPAREKTKKPASSGKKASTEKTPQEKPEDDVKLYEKHSERNESEEKPSRHAAPAPAEDDEVLYAPTRKMKKVVVSEAPKQDGPTIKLNRKDLSEMKNQKEAKAEKSPSPFEHKKKKAETSDDDDLFV